MFKSTHVQLPQDTAWIQEQILENSLSGILLMDAQQPDNPIRYVNPAFEHLTGYTAAEVLGQNPRILFHGDSEQLDLADISHRLAAQQDVRLTIRSTRKDGTSFWNELHISLIRDAQGIVTHYASTFNDVTARVEAEANLTHYQKIFESNSAVTLLIDPISGAIVNANPAAAAFYGYSLDQLKSMHIQDINTMIASEISRTLQQVAAQSHTAFTTRHRLASGEVRDVDVYASPIDTPQGRFNNALIVDVTERQQVEKALHRSEENYRLIAENASDIIMKISMEGVRTFVSPSYYTILGYRPEEVVGQSAFERMPDSKEQIRQMLTADTKHPLLSQRQVQHKDGHSVWVETTYSIVRDAATGNPTELIGVVRDISKRKQVEDELRENEYKFRSFLEQSNDGMVMTDEDGRIIEWNSSAAHLTGISSDRATGQFIWDIQYQLAPPAQRSSVVYEQIKAMTLSMLQTGSGIWLNRLEEWTVQRENGSSCAMQSHLFAIKTASGFRLGNLMRDVTKHKQMEDTLRESEERYRQTIAVMQEGLVLQKANGAIQFCNPAAERILGLTADQMMGRTSTDPRWRAIHEDYTPFPGETHPAMLTLRTGEPQFNVVMGVYKPDDTLTWILINAQPLFNEVQEKPYAVVVTFADITDRKQMEDALRESEAKYRMIAENTSDGILMLDGRSGAITYASPSYDRQHGRAIGETLQMSPEALRAAIHPDDREWVLQMIYQGIENRVSDLSYVFRSLHKDGHYFWSEDYNHMNYAPDGTYLFSNIISRDVTERKELEATLETKRAEILTQFIRDSAHEFRTPLSIIGSSTYLLTRLDDPDQRQHKAEQINEQIKRMTHLLDMLTLMVRLENREAMTEHPLNIHEVLQESTMQIIDIYGAKRAFRYEAPANLPTVMGNSDLLIEAFQQVLENACRFTPPGGSITLTAGAANQHVWVEVADTGRGIAPENLPNIFKTFWRQDDSHTTAGFGLGLTIVNRIIQRHGGTISVQSEVGQGTRVRITLPAAPA